MLTAECLAYKIESTKSNFLYAIREEKKNNKKAVYKKLLICFNQLTLKK